MSEGALSLENTVVVTRGTGRYYVSDDRGKNIVNVLNAQDRPFMLKIGENFVQTNDIIGVVTAAQVDDMEKRRRGLWQCGKGNWHNRDEVCKCGWGMSDSKKEPEPEKTPEQEERSQLLIQLIKKKRFPKNVGELTNDQLKEMLK